MAKYILVETDGYSIEHAIYTDYKNTYEEMEKRYKEYSPSDNSERFADISYISEQSAILYANGENVYVWSIITVE